MEKDGLRPSSGSPDDIIEMKRRLLVSAHLKEAGPSGVDGTFQRFFPALFGKGSGGTLISF